MAISTKYRNYIRNKYGSIHRVDGLNEPRKRWKINRDHIRDTFIDEYLQSGLIPTYMITRSYYYDETSRDAVVSDNKRMNNVLNDFFNPRAISSYWIELDHFIERGGDKLVKTKPKTVRNTITNENEYDWEVKVKKGSYHCHSLCSYIQDEVITNPTKRIRDAIDRIWGIGEIPMSLRDDDGLEIVKMELIKYALKERCDFIGNGSQCLDVSPTSETSRFDGFIGWKGAVAYCTKMMYNVDKMVEIYDHKNSSILGGDL